MNLYENALEVVRKHFYLNTALWHKDPRLTKWAKSALSDLVKGGNAIGKSWRDTCTTVTRLTAEQLCKIIVIIE